MRSGTTLRLGAVLILSVPLSGSLPAQTPAFPGAEGFGRYSRGGGGGRVIVEANHIIIRYLRLRFGEIDSPDVDAFTGCPNIQRGRQGPLIIDHCSASWSIDDAASFYDNRNFTMQWCYVMESLAHAHHAKGPHGYRGGTQTWNSI